MKAVLVAIDVQNCFAREDGSLFVPGSPADVLRMNAFIKRNAKKLTIYASQDAHVEKQIFFPSWWHYADTGKPVDVFAMIVLNDHDEPIEFGTNRKVIANFDPAWSLKYLIALRQGKKKNLIIWPYHALKGTVGQHLVTSFAETLADYSAITGMKVNFVEKGDIPGTEHFGIFVAEVPFPGAKASYRNDALLRAIASFDLIYFAGQAKSHCVLDSIDQFVTAFKKRPDILRRVRILTDCMSSVKHPAIDFDALAETRFKEFAKLGVQLVTSTAEIG